MKKLLITGAYGLVGSNICKRLERDFPDVEITKVKFEVVYDNEWGLVSGYFSDPVYFGNDSFDYVIHAAGYGQPQMFGKDKIKTIEINTRTTNDLFRAIRPGGKFLYVSTSEVYSGAKTPYTEQSIGTTTPQHPRACYIEGKRCGEAICMAYRDQGYDVKIARLALAYGPGTKKGDTRVINQFIEQAITKKEIVMKDKGEAQRTYLYIDDCVDMLLNILFKGTQPVYNVGGVDSVSIAQLAYQIADLTDSEVSYGKEGLKGAPDNVKLSLALTLTEFPRTFISLKEGLKRTIEYQKQLYV